MDTKQDLGLTLRTAAQAEYQRAEAERERLETKRSTLLETQVLPRIAQLTGALLMTTPPNWQWKIEHSGHAFQMGWSKRDQVSGYINVHVEGLTEWRQLLPLFAALGTQGYDEELWTSHDDAASYTRIYSYKAVNNEPEEAGLDHEGLAIQLHATLPGDTEDCMRVLVGYKKRDEYYAPREEPKYEFRCKSDEGHATPDDDLPL